MKGSRLIILLVLTVACVAVVELGYQLLENLVLVQDSHHQVITDQEVPQNQTVASRKEAVAAILQRNLFTASVHQQEVPADEPRPSELKLILLGTVRSDTGDHRAIILDEQSFTQDMYALGGQIQGAEIVEIQRGKVVLARGGKRETLDISKAAELNPKDGTTVAPPEAVGLISPPAGTLAEAPVGRIISSDKSAETPVSTGARQRMRSRIVRPVTSPPSGQ